MKSVVITIAILATLVTQVRAQANHNTHHDVYIDWVNRNGKGCCNGQDCGTLGGDMERAFAGRLEVKIEGTWCPVLPHHYLKTGNAPDWSTAHVCVQKPGFYTPLNPCDRLLCYQPKPSF